MRADIADHIGNLLVAQLAAKPWHRALAASDDADRIFGISKVAVAGERGDAAGAFRPFGIGHVAGLADFAIDFFARVRRRWLGGDGRGAKGGDSDKHEAAQKRLDHFRPPGRACAAG